MSGVTDEAIIRFCSRSRPEAVFSLVEGGKTVGIAEVHLNGDNRPEMALSIELSHRGKGFGKKLMMRVLEYISGKGYDTLMLHYFSQNTAISHMCHALGAETRRDGSEVTSIIHL